MLPFVYLFFFYDDILSELSMPTHRGNNTYHHSSNVAIVVYPAQTFLLVELNPAVETGNGFGPTGNSQLSHHHVLKATTVQDGGRRAGAGIQVKPEIVEFGAEVPLAADKT